MRLAKKSILFFLTDVGTSVIGFLDTLYFARVLGDEVLGMYFVVIAVLGWLRIPTYGVSKAINKRISEGKDANEIFSAGVIINLGYGLIVTVVVLLGSGYVNRYVGADVSDYFSILLIFNILFILSLEGLQGRKKVATAGGVRLLNRVLRAGLQVALVLLGYSVTAMVGGHALALLAASLVGVFLFGFKPKLPSRGAYKSVFDYGRYSWLGMVKNKSFSWMDILVLGFFVSKGFIGVYEVSWRIASFLVLASNAVQKTIFPEISDLSQSGEEEEVSKLLNEALFYAGLLVIPGFFGVMVLGEKILRIYGAEFVKGAPVLLILVLARIFNVYEMQILNVINGVNRPDVAFRLNFVFLVVNVALNITFIYLYGWIGAAVATALSSLTILFLGYKMLDEITGIPHLPIRGISMQIVAGIIMAAVLYVLREVSPISNMFVTVGMVFLGAGIYGGLLFLLSDRIRRKVLSLAPI
ncbi:MAG: polysaccharide biosynthesis C-terminal domain-containing protein [Halobacteria archaeon]